jgi:hypothetical protein
LREKNLCDSRKFPHHPKVPLPESWLSIGVN